MSAARGLTEDEARRRLADAGPNEVITPRHGVAAVAASTFLGNPLVLILLGAAALSAALGQTIDAALIALMVAVGIGLDVLQTHRSQRAADRLRQTVTPTATVVRDGIARELARRALVPGDLIRLAAGDRVPADARLVESRDLHVLFVIRTAGHPFRSRPSVALTATTLAVVAVALALPFTPLAAPLGFVPLPAPFFVFLAAVTVTYLALVEVVKRRLFRTGGVTPPTL